MGEWLIDFPKRNGPLQTLEKNHLITPTLAKKTLHHTKKTKCFYPFVTSLEEILYWLMITQVCFLLY
jgi:hypothetical protein